jgi:hypothetical protein
MKVVVTESPAQGGAFRWELRGAFELLAERRLQLRAYLTQQAMPADVAADVVLAVQEASKNANPRCENTQDRAAMRPTRMAALSLMASLLLLASACGYAKSTAASSGSARPSSSPSATPTDRLLGWWFTSQFAPSALHLVKADGRYQTGGKILIVRHRKLVVSYPGGLRIAYTLSPDGRHLYARWFVYGKLSITARYRRATTAEISVQITRENGNRLADAIRLWRLRTSTYPARTAVRFGGAFQPALNPWPTNPYTGKPMSAGSGPGDYRYTFNRGGFTLTWFIGSAGQGSISESAHG